MVGIIGAIDPTDTEGLQCLGLGRRSEGVKVQGLLMALAEHGFGQQFHVILQLFFGLFSSSAISFRASSVSARTAFNFSELLPDWLLCASSMMMAKRLPHDYPVPCR